MAIGDIKLTLIAGSFSLFSEDKLRELIDLAHEHGVYVSTVELLGTRGQSLCPFG